MSSSVPSTTNQQTNPTISESTDFRIGCGVFKENELLPRVVKLPFYKADDAFIDPLPPLIFPEKLEVKKWGIGLHGCLSWPLSEEAKAMVEKAKKLRQDAKRDSEKATCLDTKTPLVNTEIMTKEEAMASCEVQSVCAVDSQEVCDEKTSQSLKDHEGNKKVQSAVLKGHREGLKIKENNKTFYFGLEAGLDYYIVPDIEDFDKPLPGLDGIEEYFIPFGGGLYFNFK